MPEKTDINENDLWVLSLFFGRLQPRILYPGDQHAAHDQPRDAQTIPDRLEKNSMRNGKEPESRSTPFIVSVTEKQSVGGVFDYPADFCL